MTTSGRRRIATPRGPKTEEGATIGAGRVVAGFCCKAGREDGSGTEETFDATFPASPPEEATKGLLSATGTKAFIPAGSFGGASGGCLIVVAEVCVVVRAVLVGRGGGEGNEAARKLGG